MDSSNFQPPIRRSLSNEDLEARVNQAMSSHSGVESAMELLVSQEALKAQEDIEINAWLQNMQQLGTPEALRAIEAFRGQEQGYEPPKAETSRAEDSETTPPEQGSSWLISPSLESTITEQAEPEHLPPAASEQATSEPVVEPFSWFTQTPEPSEVETTIVTEQVQEPLSSPIEEDLAAELEPVGSESRNDFEALLAAAAAEEELTALEEKQAESSVQTPRTKKQKKATNAVTPKRKGGFGSPVLIWLGLTALVAPIALVWALIGSDISSPAIAITFGVGILVSLSIIAHAALAGRRNDIAAPLTASDTQTVDDIISDTEVVQDSGSDVQGLISEQLPVSTVAEVASFDPADIEPTAMVTQNNEANVLIPSDENRNRGFSSQLLIWLGLSSTLAPIVLVWSLIGSGLSAPAIAIVLSVGYLISGSLIALSVLAGKRSGQSTSTTSRAVFGVWGNALPSGLMFVTRVTLLALLVGTFALLMNGIDSRIPDFGNVLFSSSGFSITVGLVVQICLLLTITVLSALRGVAARVIQVLFSVLAFALVVESFLSLTSSPVRFESIGTEGLISETALAGVAMILMVNLTQWFAIGPNLSKAIPVTVKGYKVFMAAFVSNFVAPVIVGVIALVWLGQVSLQASEGFSINEAVLGLPAWAQGSLLTGIALALVYAMVSSARSAALDLVAIFRLKGRILALTISVTAAALLLALFAQQPSSQQVEYLTNVFALVAAASAGWIGIFAGDVLVRKIPYHELSLARAYGVYKKFNILSLVTWMLTIASAVALMPVSLYGLNFMGFALTSLGMEANLATSALGFTATLLLGILLTLIIRIPQIRKQESEINELEARREQLNDIFLVAE
jgi:purine-cytosine permease-like protein